MCSRRRGGSAAGWCRGRRDGGAGGWTAAVPIPRLDSEQEPDDIDTEALLEELAYEEPQRLSRESWAIAEGDLAPDREVFVSPDFARRFWATTVQQFPHCFPAQRQVMAEVVLQSLD